MLVENQSLDDRAAVEHLRRRFRQPEAGPHVRHKAEPLAVDVAAERLRVGLIDQAQHRGRMRMVDEARRHEGMQQHFHRR